MKYSIVPVLAIVANLAGCMLAGTLSPVEGPLSQQNPVPTYIARLTGLLSGSISVVLANGEVCKGSWAFVSRSSSADTGATALAAPPVNMAADWDLVYGPGYYVAHVVGNQLYARATLKGNKGTVLNVEFSNEGNLPGNTKGVAQDNHGNIFKVIVYN